MASEVVDVFHRNGKLFQWRRTQYLCPQEALVKACLYENRDISMDSNRQMSFDLSQTPTPRKVQHWSLVRRHLHPSVHSSTTHNSPDVEAPCAHPQGVDKRRRGACARWSITQA